MSTLATTAELGGAAAAHMTRSHRAAGGIEPGPAVIRRTIDLTLQPEAGAAHGRQRILYENNQDAALGEIYLRLWPNVPAFHTDGAGAGVRNVTVNGAKRGVTTTTDGSVIRIQLPKPLATGERVVVEHDFWAHLPERHDRMGVDPKTGMAQYNYTIPSPVVRDADGWNVDPYSEGESFYALSTDVRARIHSPEGTTVMTSGHETSPMTTTSDGMQHQTVSAPNVRDLAVVTGPSTMRELSKRVAGTNVRVFVPKGVSQETAEQIRNDAVDSVRFFSEKYGAYGARELKIVATPNLHFGMEHPNLATVDSRHPEKVLREQTTHEVGHQWFYSIVGNNQFDEPYLDEMLTSYITSRRLGTTPVPWEFPPGTRISSPTLLLERGDGFGNVYEGGDGVMHKLAAKLGVETVDAGIRRLVEQKRNGIATTKSFIDAFNDAARTADGNPGLDLTRWFRDHGIRQREPYAAYRQDPNAKRVRAPDGSRPGAGAIPSADA